MQAPDLENSSIPPASKSEEPSSLLLATKSINKHFAKRKILENIDLSINEGQIVTLIGPNGAGKTVLVRIALGLMQPDSGTIYHRPSLCIGYMPQRVHVEPTLPLTVKRFLQLANRHDRELIASTLKDLKISHLEQQQLSAISGGELQRVLLARALLRKPQLLILDEPAQGVDLAGQAELYQLISEISSKQGCGVLMISHDLHLVMSSTDEVICLNHHVCCHGKPEHVSNDPAYLNLFGANASKSLAVYTHHHNHEHDLTGNVKECKHD
jgi:zinc transport system ATP-binding protein